MQETQGDNSSKLDRVQVLLKYIKLEFEQAKAVKNLVEANNDHAAQALFDASQLTKPTEES